MEISIPRYNLLYEKYINFSFIEVVDDARPKNGFLIFHNFVTHDKPFDAVSCIKIDLKGNRIDDGFVDRPAEKTEFVFRYRRRLDEIVNISDLHIKI